MNSGGFSGLHSSTMLNVTSVLWSQNFFLKIRFLNQDVNGRSNECVVWLTIKDILAHLPLLSGQKDAQK